MLTPTNAGAVNSKQRMELCETFYRDLENQSLPKEAWWVM